MIISVFSIIEKSLLMKRIVLFIFIFSVAGLIGAILGFKAKRINYVYVPHVPGPTDACTDLLLDYTIVNNGQPPVIRTASSLPVTVGCRLVSIYPDGEDGF